MGKFMPSRSLLFMGLTLAVIRVAMGWLWLSNLSWKLPPTFDCEPGEGDGLCYWMGEMVEYSYLPPHAWFVESVALPHYEVFGYLVVGMELLTGVLLVLGLLTRFAAVLGVFQSANLFIGLSSSPDEWVWSYLMMILLHMVLLATAAGRYFGVDAYLHDRWKSSGREDRPAQIGALST
ncbi:MAG: DoxX family membrane protein [Chloroflexia bacterium]|jgi:thiosulfate dehydrogenase [quinone] large subunit|nr:DoxX family membrane protein [Chloroflexia bacterium]